MNQAFTVTPAGDTVIETGADRQFTVAGIDASTVDIALVTCANVDVDEDGNAAFVDADNDNDVDYGTVDFAHITNVNGVALAGNPDFVNDAIVDNNDITVTVDTTGPGCYVVVVFDDADDDNNLDLDANNMPTEDFAVSGETTAATVAALDAAPEYSVNRYGETHTVTAQLEEADGDVVALAGESIRFTVYEADLDAGETANEVTQAECAAGSAIQVQTVATDANGVATFSYSLADPNTGAVNADTDHCINAVWLDNTGMNDWVGKTWSEAAPAANSLELTPAQDTNPVNTQHTVTATVTDQFGNPVNSNVTFELYRELNEVGDYTLVANTTQATGTDGVVSFAYTGPNEEADDVVIACVDNDTPADGCDASIVAASGVVTLDGGELDDSAEKFWVATATSTDDAADNSCVQAADTAANIIDVERATTGDNFRYVYDAEDRFNVNGAPVTLAQFENNVTAEDRIRVDYTTDGISTFTLVNDDDCTLELGEQSTAGGIQGDEVGDPDVDTFTGSSTNEQFTVVFTEPVNQATFTCGDVTLTDNSAAPAIGTCEGITFTDIDTAVIDVTGDVEDTDTATIAAESVSDLAGNTGPAAPETSAAAAP